MQTTRGMHNLWEALQALRWWSAKFSVYYCSWFGFIIRRRRGISIRFVIHQGSARQGSSYVRQYKGSAKFQSRRCGNGSVDSDSSDRVRQALAVVVNVRSVPMVVPWALQWYWQQRWYFEMLEEKR